MSTPRPTRRWIPIDELFNAVDNLPEQLLPPRTRPVQPASDDECYRLNPPHSCYGAQRTAGLRQARTTPRKSA
ncbi:MAG: hypothetical protein ACJ786_36200 [Catenulispora sp.]